MWVLRRPAPTMLSTVGLVRDLQERSQKGSDLICQSDLITTREIRRGSFDNKTRTVLDLIWSTKYAKAMITTLLPSMSYYRYARIDSNYTCDRYEY